MGTECGRRIIGIIEGIVRIGGEQRATGHSIIQRGWLTYSSAPYMLWFLDIE